MTAVVTVATPAHLFAELEGRFDSYLEFENALVARFNAQALEFPRGYSWRDVLNWGISRNLVGRDGKEIIVTIPG